LNPELKVGSEIAGHKPSYFFKRYTADEGFLGIGTYWGSVTQDQEGNLWFATKGRITNYHPEGDIPDTVAPTIQLTGIKLFDENISWYDLDKRRDSNLVLTNGTTIKKFHFGELTPFYNQPKDLKLLHDNNYITFQFIGITTNRPKEVKYKYFLKGFDEKWSAPTAQPEATYNNLPPGKYVFKVKATNSEGYWSKELSYPFRIFPPWWKTWWAYTLFAIAVITILFGTIRWFLQQKYRSQLEKSEKEKEIAEIRQKASEMEMQALRAQMNPHFIFNSLNSINRFILQNNRAQASEYLTKFSKLVRMILQNSQASLISLESELESLNLYLDLEAVRFEHRFAYKISCPKDLDIEVLKVPPLVIQPFTENAIWHGLMHKEDKGQLDIDVSEEDDYLYVKISDNGIGRKKAAELASKSATKHKSMGLRITKDRIAMLQKSNGGESPVKIIDLENEDGSAAGTEVVLKMPIVYD
jgi:anti-sigma regulatory factor (Ser/Thr protein kinase)